MLPLVVFVLLLVTPAFSNSYTTSDASAIASASSQSSSEGQSSSFAQSSAQSTTTETTEQQESTYAASSQSSSYQSIDSADWSNLDCSGTTDDEINLVKKPVNRPCPRRCKQTCALPNPDARYCRSNPNCFCGGDLVFPDSRNNTCIPIWQCQEDINIGCNGDPNAKIQENPSPCQATCKKPSRARNCSLKPVKVGCVCKQDYILSKVGGKCIHINKCPGGYPKCKANEIFNSCNKECPFNFCPSKDEPTAFVCSFPGNCPAGCTCKEGYRRSGSKCILPQDCPPLKCTKPNEEWNRCPSPCFSDSCSSVINPPKTCETFAPAICNPQCVCKSGYGRGDDNICIPVAKCVSS